MAHVVLINPPALKGHTNERTYSGGIGVARPLRPGQKDPLGLPPIDLLYTAAVAERAGARVTIIDLLLDRFHGAKAERFCSERIGEADEQTWIGIRLSIPSLLQDLAFGNRIKELHPRAKVFGFGTVIMATVDHWVRDCRMDFLLYGEPEAMLDKVLAASDFRQVEGVLCPDAYTPLEGDDLWDGAKNEARVHQWVKVRNLLDLPRPAWHLLPLQRYAPDGDLSRLGVFVQASRGCPIGCTMCPYMVLEGKPWRNNAIESVVDEIEHLNKTYGIYRVRFRDPNFGFNRRYARELCEALIRRGVKLSATVETSVEVFDEDNLRKMYQAGIRTITTGIETNDADCMESIGQKISVNDKLREKIALCHEIGFHIYGTFCLGTPEETWETVEKTWRFANELDVESGFTVMTPFPGTPMYWRALREGLIPRRMRYSDWNSYTATMRTNQMSTRDLEIARLWARLETIIPYRMKRARRQGPAAVIRTALRLTPHYLVRQVLRVVVWHRRSRSRGTASREGVPAAAAAE